MQQWYYVKNGQQQGPVQLEQLRSLASSGELNTEDLVWNAEMKDWTPAGEIDGIFSSRPAADPAMVETEVVDDTHPSPETSPLEPIEPGSESLDIGLIISRTFELTKRNFANIALLGVIFFAITSVLSILAQIGQGTQSFYTNPMELFEGQQDSFESQQFSSVDILRLTISTIIQQVVTTYLTLGLYRCCLRMLANQPVELSMLFGEGRILVKAVLASIVIGVLVILGLILLIFPGIYIALRLSQVLPAIVDRDMSIGDAISYSAEITKNNLLSLFGLWIVAIVMVIVATIITCGVGAIFINPIMALGCMLTYRYLQYGRRAAMDHPGTQIPMLSAKAE